MGIRFEPYAIVDDTATAIHAYVPIPRCASNSIMRVLEAKLGLPRSQNPHYRRWPLTASLMWLQQHPEVETWTVVRSPWERLVSLWTGFLGGSVSACPDLPAHPQLQRYADATFTQFIQGICDEPLDDIHLWPAYRFVTRDGTMAVSRVLRYKQLRDNWEDLQRRYGLGDLPHENRGDHASWRAYYGASTAAMVAKKYERDLELFQFTYP